MEAFDWPRILLNDLPLNYLTEVLFRVVFAYFLAFAFLRISGRRGIRQLSLFELLIILTLGSAAGDVTFQEDVPILPVAAVFVFLLLLYRLTTLVLDKVPALGGLVEGLPITMIRDGVYELDAIDRVNLTSDEILMELRQCGVEHLGQVRLGIMEPDGDISLYLFDGDEVRPGLSVLPPEHRQVYRSIPADGLYACTYCGAIESLATGTEFHCRRCKRKECSKALSSRSGEVGRAA